LTSDGRKRSLLGKDQEALTIVIENKAICGMAKMISNSSGELAALENIKRTAVKAMFSDDLLLEELVLKGGNAMALIHRLSSRASVDLDFSLKDDFPGGWEGMVVRIEAVLTKTFRLIGYEAFDIKMEEKPNAVTKDLASFWGGYAIEFKLVGSDHFSEHRGDIAKLRNHAINIGQGKKFLIDISRFEHVDGKEEAELEGYRIFVYSPLMIVCEKLRAICQQMAEYGPVVKRTRLGSVRPRDFFDIFVLVSKLNLDITTPEVLETLAAMFEIKHVPLTALGLIPNYREFHRTGFQSVVDTVIPEVDLQSYDFYFDYVVRLTTQINAQLAIDF
jgi:predicted nucleotidyltransferase component of viral defense system